MLPDLPFLDILGVPVARLTRDEAAAAVERAALEDAPALVGYVNAHTINLACGNPAYLELLRERAAVLLNDGSGVAIAGRLQGRPFFENLNGTDFNLLVLGIAARRKWPVYLMGAKPGVAERAAHRLVARIPGLRIAGVRDGFFEAADEPRIVGDIRASGAGVILVGMGNPKQELWLDRHLAATGARLGVGVGAFFDFAAGEVRRAPGWMIRLGIEWVHRLAVEPGRLWRRYVLGNPIFLFRLLRDRLSSRTTNRRGRFRGRAR